MNRTYHIEKASLKAHEPVVNYGGGYMWDEVLHLLRGYKHDPRFDTLIDGEVKHMMFTRGHSNSVYFVDMED